MNKTHEQKMWDRDYIIMEASDVLTGYVGEQVTIRQLYYQLVNRGMPNSQSYYKRVVGAMEKARWSGVISFDAFVDHERGLVCETSWEDTDLGETIRNGEENVLFLMDYYSLNRWENQPEYIEVWIEKKALQGVVLPVCEKLDVGLFPCKGYPSLTALNEAYMRFNAAYLQGKHVTILYCGDHDPSGDDIPRSVVDNLKRMGMYSLDLERIALTYDQVEEYHLPPAPTKTTDTRSASWGGHGQVELDAVDPSELRRLIEEAVLGHFDPDLYDGLKRREEEEGREYRKAIKTFVNNL